MDYNLITKPNQIKNPNQIKPNQSKPNQINPNQTKSNEGCLYSDMRPSKIQNHKIIQDFKR